MTPAIIFAALAGSSMIVAVVLGGPRPVIVVPHAWKATRSYLVMPSDGCRFSWTLPDNARMAFELSPGVVAPSTWRTIWFSR